MASQVKAVVTKAESEELAAWRAVARVVAADKAQATVVAVAAVVVATSGLLGCAWSAGQSPERPQSFV